MVELKVRMSTKGQIVIPKMIRDINKMYPSGEFIIRTEGGKTIIEKQEEDIIEFLNKVSEEAARRRKGKKFVYNKMEFYEQHDKRAKRAGL